MTQEEQEEVKLLKELIADKSISADEREIYQDALNELMKSEKPKATTTKSKPTTTQRKTRTTPTKKVTPAKTKQTATDVEKAKAEIKAKTGKTEAECESIIEQYRALRTKAQEGKRKAEQASADNKERVGKLERKGDIIAGTNEKTADAVIESTAKDVADKIEKQVEAIEAKAEKEAKAEVAKDKSITSAKDKKEAVEAIVDEQVKKKTKTIVKRVVIDTSALLTSIASSLGKFDKDSQKEFLIKLRSDIDKLLSKYAFGGMTDGATQVMNVQQSNMSSSSVNPSQFEQGGGVRMGSDGREYPYGSAWQLEHNKNNKNEDYEVPASKRKYSVGGTLLSGMVGAYVGYQYGKKGKKAFKFEDGGMMAHGGVVGQEIVFDDNGEENTGVIKEIHETTGDYIVSTDDGRTVLVQLDRDVISLGGMRKAMPMEAPRKRFGFFEEGGRVEKDKYIVEWLEDDMLQSEYYDSNELELAKELYYQIKETLFYYQKQKIFISDRNTGDVIFGEQFEYAQGGGIGFKGLSEKVAQRYEGKKVPPKYQGEYGKRYSESEAKEVGDKVASKVYREQMGRKMAIGGMTEHGLEIGDEIMGYTKDVNELHVINRKNDEWHSVDLDDGKRYAGGGGISNSGLKVILQEQECLNGSVITGEYYIMSERKDSNRKTIYTIIDKEDDKIYNCEIPTSVIMNAKARYDYGGRVDSEIAKYKKQLINKAKTKGLYENFGQSEVRKLEDKYGYTNEVREFDNWVMNFDSSQME